MRCLHFARLPVLALIVPFVPCVHGQDREMTPAELKAADMRMPELDRSALEPEKREPAVVREGERNPFGLVAPPVAEPGTAVLETETEENRLRRILGSMRVSGLSGSSGSYRVVLGAMQIKEGERLPKMFADQAEVLRVTSINDGEIKLTFEEKDPSLPPRTIGIGYDLRPRPQSLLPGEVFGKLVPFGAGGVPSLEPLEVPAVTAISEGAEAGRLQGLTERSFQMMGEPDFRSEDESTEEKPN